MLISRPTGELKVWTLCGLALLGSLGPCIAGATLGEPETSVEADGVQIQGSGAIKIASHANFRMHEIQTSSGTVVREFAGLDGTVFAVAWAGPTLPNLRQTLGRYFDGYVKGAKANRLGHHHLSIQQSDLVIESSGHMRAFSGRAYLPSALPAGVSVGELR